MLLSLAFNTSGNKSAAEDETPGFVPFLQIAEVCAVVFDQTACLASCPSRP